MKRILMLLGLLFSSCVYAQGASTLIKNANLITLESSGVMENTDLLIKDGVIRKIGTDLSRQGVDQFIDAAGMYVTPGLINAYSTLGLTEIGRVPNTVDFVVRSEESGASVKVASLINFNSTLLPHNMYHGLTMSISRPVSMKQVYGGQGVVMRLGGDVDKVINDSVAVYAQYGAGIASAYGNDGGYGGGSRALAFHHIERGLREAQKLLEYESSFFKLSRPDFTLPGVDLRALIPVLKGEKPLVVTVHRAADINAILSLKTAYDIKLILAGVSEGWMVAEQIAKANVPVIMDAMHDISASFEMHGASEQNATLLHRAGVKLIFAPVLRENAHIAYQVRTRSALAVANGLPWLEAIKAMTINPAEVFGFSDNFGSLRIGKQADIVVWDGDPLEILSIPTHVFIAGEKMPMITRATLLYLSLIHI